MSTALVHLEAMTALEIFKPGTIDPVLEAIETEARAQAACLDISTEANRKEIASLAFKVAKSKTFVEAQRKALVADEKKRLAKIDEEGRRIWNRFEALQTEVRKPLTDWEQADKDRIACHEEALNILTQLAILPGFYSVADAEERIEKVNNLHDQRPWEEFTARANGQKAASLFTLHRCLVQAQKAEEECAELERHRAEEAERQIKEREAAAAKAATEAAERRAETERTRLQQEAEYAERKRVAQEQEAKRQLEAAEARRVSEAAQAERDKEAAIERERQRAADAKLAEDAAAERRERHHRHKLRINREAAAAIETHCQTPTGMAETIIEAIAKGLITGVNITY